MRTRLSVLTAVALLAAGAAAPPLDRRDRVRPAPRLLL